MFQKLCIVLTAAFLLIPASTLLASDCNACHVSKGVRESVPAVEPIAIKADGKIRNISLNDAFRFHGHSCPGMATTFRAMQYGIRLLFNKEIPEQKDLAVISRTPVDGVLDMLDLLMIGEKQANKTSAPEGMTGGRDAFYFTLYRKSTSTAVDIHLKPEHYPKDFFEYKKSRRIKS
jgi:hypothetical protein